MQMSLLYYEENKMFKIFMKENVNDNENDNEDDNENDNVNKNLDKTTLQICA